MAAAISATGASLSALLRGVVTAAYVAAGAGDDYSHLLCNVTTGTRELLFMLNAEGRFQLRIRDEEELRTRAALREALSTSAELANAYSLEVVGPGREIAARHTKTARAMLVRKQIVSTVVDPTALDIGSIADEANHAVRFVREDYLEMNGNLMRRYSQRVIICPEVEFGSGLASDLDATLGTGIEMFDLEGDVVTRDDLAALVGSAGKWMVEHTFTESEVERYIGPSALTA